MYSRRFLSTTTAYKTVVGLLLSFLQLSNFNESKPSIVVNNTSLSPCQLLDEKIGRRYHLNPNPPISSWGRGGENIMRPLNQILEQRWKRVCLGCFEASSVTNLCNCTLRNRFVDRWVCITCYQRECQEDFEAVPLTYSGINYYYECACKRTLRSHEPEKFRILCNWCNGEIVDGLADKEHIPADLGDDDSDDSEKNNEEKEKTPAELRAQGFLPYHLEILTDDEYEQLIDRGQSVDWLSQECFSHEDLRKWVRKQKEDEEYERVVASGDHHAI
jgi:hypothetical protein